MWEKLQYVLVCDNGDFVDFVFHEGFFHYRLYGETLTSFARGDMHKVHSGRRKEN